MRKLLAALIVGLTMIGGAAAQTSDVWNTTDQVISEDQVYTSDAFTGDNLTEIETEISLNSGETLNAVLEGYNSTEITGNQTFELADGISNSSIQSFDENTTTYVVDFNATGGDVTVLDASIRGDSINETASGVAPGTGGFLTGSFFEGVPIVSQVVNFFGSIINSIGAFIQGGFTG